MNINDDRPLSAMLNVCIVSILLKNSFSRVLEKI